MFRFRMLIYQIEQRGLIDYDRFNQVYTGLVEMKLQSILKDIERINSKFLKDLRRRNEAGLPNKGMPAETQMKLAVLETLYAYLKTDDAFQQRAFELFLKKKMEENGANYSKIKAYLKNRRRNYSYDEYIKCTSTPITVYLPKLWTEFLRSGKGYMDIIPKELPRVAYSCVDTDIPRFIFADPAHEYSEQEFFDRFIEEFDSMHYNPRYEDDCYDPVDYADYDMQLADKPENAYLHYICAVSRYKQIQQRLEADKGGGER